MSPVRTGQMSCDVEHTLSCCATHNRSTIAPRVNQLGVVRVGKSLPEWLIEDDAAGHPHVDHRAGARSGVGSDRAVDQLLLQLTYRLE